MARIDWNAAKRELGLAPGEAAAMELDEAQGIELLPARTVKFKNGSELRFSSGNGRPYKSLFTKIPPDPSKR